MTPKGSKTTPRAPQNEPKTRPRGPKKRTQTARRKKDRTKTIPRPSWTAQRPICLTLTPPHGRHLGGQNGTKTDPKTIKNRSENRRGKKSHPRRSWTLLGAIMGRFGAPSWGKKRLKPFILNGLVKNHFFDDKTVRRRFGDQLRRAKSPKGAKMTPKRDPGSTPKRPKIDIQIDINFDAKTKRA